MSLSGVQIERYSRQIVLPEVGGRGQRELLSARMLVAGHGALARLVTLYLAAAGVGEIALFAAGAEASSRCAELADLNPDVQARAVAEASGEPADAWIDASGDDRTRRRLLCAASAPLLAGDVAGSGGWIARLTPDAPPCACLAGPAGPADAALEPSTVGVVGSLLVMEALKLRLRTGEPLAGVLRYDAHTGRFERSAVHPAGSALCGGGA